MRVETEEVTVYLVELSAQEARNLASLMDNARDLSIPDDQDILRRTIMESLEYKMRAKGDWR